MSKVAAFFDLDKTIIATSTSAAFTRPLYDGGLVSRGEVARTALSHAHYLLTGADAENTERLRKQLSELATGWDVEKVKEVVADAVETHIDPHVYKEALNLIAEHHELGHDVVIISASVDELVEPIAQLLGADHYVATIMGVEDGKYTGDISFYAYGEAKADAIRELAEKYDYDLARSYAYSDSVTDAPMLDTVGYGTVVNPDKALRRLAVEHGWDQLIFQNPTSFKASVSSHIAGVPVRVEAARERISHIPDHVAEIQERVSGIPERVAEMREEARRERKEKVVAEKPVGRDKSGTGPIMEVRETVGTAVKDNVPDIVKNNPKKSAAIAAGIAVAGAAIAAASRNKDDKPKAEKVKIEKVKLEKS